MVIYIFLQEIFLEKSIEMTPTFWNQQKARNVECFMKHQFLTECNLGRIYRQTLLSSLSANQTKSMKVCLSVELHVTNPLPPIVLTAWLNKFMTKFGFAPIGASSLSKHILTPALPLPPSLPMSLPLVLLRTFFF